MYSGHILATPDALRQAEVNAREAVKEGPKGHSMANHANPTPTEWSEWDNGNMRRPVSKKVGESVLTV